MTEVENILAILVSAILVALAGALVLRRYRTRHAHPDRRSTRELVGAVALLIVALSAALSALFSIAVIGDLAVRRTLAGMAWAALISYFVVQLQDDDEALA